MMAKKLSEGPDGSSILPLSERMAGVAPGAEITLAKLVAGGALVARKRTSGAIAFYWRWTTAGRVDRELIGLYDKRIPPKKLAPESGCYSVAGAEDAAIALAKRHAAALKVMPGGLRAAEAAEAAAQAERQAEAARAEAERAAADAARLKAEQEAFARAEAERKAREECNLRRLLLAYCDIMASLERRSHQDARSIFAVHVFAEWPALAATPANEITDEQVADVLRRIVEKGHARTAGKCRAYLAAAYELARRARTDASVPVAFKSYAVRSNPARQTATIAGARDADKNPLSADELRRYWRAIQSIDSNMGAVLRLHLLTGGQRIAQFVRLKTADISDDSILLFDGKGRPGPKPRQHPLPLLPEARKALEIIAPKGEWALSSDGGKTHLAPTTLSAAAAEAGTDIEGFLPKRIRSGVETILASAGVSLENRGRLQSHGISGVQSRHYDDFDYLPAKRAALETLLRLLEAEDGKVVPIRTAQVA